MGAMSKNAANNLVKAFREDRMVANLMTGWGHAVKGHYNFADPSQPEENGKSYFTIGVGMSANEKTNAMVKLLADTIGTGPMPEMRGDTNDNSKVYVYRQFNDVIGKSGNNADCKYVRLVLSTQSNGPSKGKPIMKTAYPDRGIYGDPLR